MGKSIDVSVYDTKELIQKLQEWGANDTDLLMSILRECGTFLAEEKLYTLAANDYAYTYDPINVLCDLLESAFGRYDAHGVFFKRLTIDIMTATEEEACEIAERLGIKLKSDEH